MANKQVNIKDPDLAKVGVALERAAANARQLGFDTNTPVYVYRDGKIVDIVKEHRTNPIKEKDESEKFTEKNDRTAPKSAIKKDPVELLTE